MRTGPAPMVIRRELKDFPPPTPLSIPCRLWQGTLLDGYAVKRVKGRKTGVHRWVVESVGEDQFGVKWDPSLYVLHLCDQPMCYRYDHLMLGTHQENVRQAVERGLSSQAKLSVEQVREIRYLHAEGFTAQHLADRFGVSRRNVYHIVRRYSWKVAP